MRRTTGPVCTFDNAGNVQRQFHWSRTWGSAHGVLGGVRRTQARGQDAEPHEASSQAQSRSGYFERGEPNERATAVVARR